MKQFVKMIKNTASNKRFCVMAAVSPQIMNKHFFSIIALSAFVLTTNFVVAQKVTITPIPSDTTVSHTKSVPKPTIYIGTNILGGIYTKEKLLENPFLSVSSEEWSIVSYKVTFVRMKGNTNNGVEDAPIMVKGANFTNEIISKIKSYPSRTVIEFTDIKIQNKAEIKIVPVTLMVRVE